MLFVKRLVVTEEDFRQVLYDFLFHPHYLNEGYSVEKVLDELWESCCSACREEDCEGFLILMNDGSFHDFEIDYPADEVWFKQLIRKHWKECLEEFNRQRVNKA
jgi:hypothetical protein